MDSLLFNVLQDQMQLTSLTAHIRHPKGYRERGCKHRYDLWIISSGTMSFTYNSKTYTLKEGAMFLMYPNTPYEALILSDYLDLVFCRFDFSLGNSPTDLINFPMAGLISKEAYQGSQLDAALKQFLLSFKADKKLEFFSSFITKQYFNVMIALFFQHQLSVNTLNDPNNKSFNASKLKRLLPAIDHISNNPDKMIPTIELAEIIGMSHKYFITYFKNVLGISPHHYQIQLKMTKAVALIKEQTYSIKEITHLLGYKDPYNFSTAFKKHFGVAPSRYLDDGESIRRLSIKDAHHTNSL